jgi:hexosaminidase
MKPLSLLAICVLIVNSIKAQDIIPQPVLIKKLPGGFRLDAKTVISANNEYADILNFYLQKLYGFTLPIKQKSNKGENVIYFTSFHSESSYSTEGYQLNIHKNQIAIASKPGTAGGFYGIQTLLQLLPTNLRLPYVIPSMEIADYPHFSYRGMHLDVGRHFFPVSFVKKYIDYLAFHKMNYFHWHLTEDQGWRIEIKKYPRLTEIGAWRNGTIIGRYPGTGNDNIRYGGFYTREEIKEVVDYAAKRYVTVIPEIEMPGHCSAAIAAYPLLSCFPNESTKHPPQCAWSGDSTGKHVQQTWGVFDDVYCAGKDSTFEFLQDVLDEVMALFPSKYIHIGGDECPKANWKRCPLCQKRMQEEHLKDEHELQSYFIQRMEKYLNSKGRTLIGWDEILEGGLAPNAVVMSWRGEAGGIAAARQNHNVIMTPGGWVYFDHSQTQNEDSVTIGGYTPVEKTYSYNPVPDSLTKEQGKYILGAQGNVWTEYMKNERKVEYMIFPRMSALSEVLWSQKKDSGDFEKRLKTQFKRYDLWKTNYSKAYFDLKATVLPTEDYNGVYWLLTSKKKGNFDIGHWAHDRSAFETIFKTDTSLKIKIFHSNNYHVEQSGQGFLTSLEQKFSLNKATGKKITLKAPPSQNYPGDGAFTLVNGVQNEKGLLRSKEVLGFSGDDLEAVIDLGTSQTISKVVVHSLNSGGSWVFPPEYAEALVSSDGKTFLPAGKSENFVVKAGVNGIITVSFAPVTGRFVKVLVKSIGIVPQAYRGAGNKAWLFVDEIEVY